MKATIYIIRYNYPVDDSEFTYEREFKEDRTFSTTDKDRAGNYARYLYDEGFLISLSTLPAL